MAPELRNLTPFANMQFANWDSHGREFGVYMVKTAWDILPDGTCALSDEQEPFVFTDEFHGVLNETALRYASDMVPYKPKTDIVLNATSFSPDKPRTDWQCHVNVQTDVDQKTLIDKSLQITGPRLWQKGWLGWKLTEAEPISQCALRYDYAYGGAVAQGDDDTGNPIIEAFEQNPVGRGFADARRLEDDTPIDAPQILKLGEEHTNPTARMTPVGVGPIPAAWLPRRPRGGTYDKHWEDNVWPLWPQDYEFRFHNTAPDDMAVDLPIGSGVKVTLTNMHPEMAKWMIHVPNPRILVHMVIGSDVINAAMMTDTIHLDIAADRLSDPRIFQVSRLVFDRTKVDQMILTRLSENEDITKLTPPPHPHDVAQFIPEDMSEIPA